ncbi:hypothetical protein [Sphingosinicella soli]|uniref:Tetratricopeptide repeat protein n=1 Tax=Sphingosinicella soli TaxID=333708 RepID=A0A7W7B0R1_9SPHN|nr:hypothetical protein [Sphingosinicella soli]MBB4631916.1 hypothetical protein [Sphingosinicella soli]
MKLAFAAAAAALLAGCTTSPTQQAEIGYTPGALGYAAMMKGDLQKAETQLMRTDADDPARLLNLAQIYRMTERDLAARDLYAKVLENDDMQLVLSNGRVVSAHTVAKSALQTTATAARN